MKTISLDETAKLLNQVSPTFCLAKWLHLGLHLERGLGHSCYHPPAHKLDVKEIEKNPFALHNSKVKLEERQLMLDGKRPPGCSYCWKVEDESPTGQYLSDRFEKSSNGWANPHFDEVLNSPTETILPRYLELSFSNLCNLKCIYCSPLYSSSWESERDRYGNMPGIRTIEVSKSNRVNSKKLIEAFWGLWPKLSEHLHVLRITGGEPLIQPELYVLLNKLLEKKQPSLSLIINSNLFVPASYTEKFYAIADSLLSNGHVKSLKIVTSMEANGRAAEFLRSGISIKSFWENLAFGLRTTRSIRFSVTATIQILSIGSFYNFVEKICDVREKLAADDKCRLHFDPALLKSPEFLSIEYLPVDQKKYFLKDLEKIIMHLSSRMTEYEKIRLKPIQVILRKDVDQDQEIINHKKSILYLLEICKRRNRDFLATFPEMESYWTEGLKLLNEQGREQTHGQI